MRACFTNFITIRDRAVSKSGLYVNDLPGINTEIFDKLRTQDHTDLDDFYSKFYERSVNNFVNVVSTKISGEFYNYKVIESRTTGEFSEEYNDSSEEYAGVQISLNESKYLEHQVLRFKVYSQGDLGSPVPNIYIFSKVGGTLLDTIPLSDLTAGENEVQYYGTFDTEKLYIAYKPAEVTLLKTVADDRLYDYQSPTSAVSQVNGGGIIVDFNSVCSPEKFICSRLQAFKYALWNFLGVELMKDRILTSKINKYTTVTAEEAERLGNEYQSNFDNAMTAIMKHHRVYDDRLCFECRGSVSSKIMLP